MNKYLLVSFLVVLLVFVGSSCKKTKENRIVGEWSYVPLNNVDNPSNDQVWTFDGSNKLNVVVKEIDTTYTYNGSYEISSKFMNGYYVDITGIFKYWNGRYKIEKLKDNVMILNRVEKNADSENPTEEGGAFLWKEFVKK